MWNDFVSLIYPRLCPGCKESLMKNEKCICTSCLTELTKTEDCKYHANSVSKLLWGRIKFDSAIALYSFTKESIIQKLMYALKYENKPNIGEILGVELGKEIFKSQRIKDIDMIIPVPLHKRKERVRGYNQSFFIAKGVSNVLKVPVNIEVLIKRNYKPSQTNKNRYNRWLNSNNTFLITKSNQMLKNKHILIVDDVITTGSTIENCVLALKNVKGLKISIATIAIS